MNRLFALLAFCTTTTLFGDVKETPYIHTEGYFESDTELFESEFSEWHLVSDMQRIFDTRDKNVIWIYQEGRNYKGVPQIRWIEREKPETTRFYIHGMLTHEEFHSYDMNYHADGYHRTSMQVFTDVNGEVRYQAVWIAEGEGHEEDE